MGGCKLGNVQYEVGIVVVGMITSGVGATSGMDGAPCGVRGVMFG